MVGVVARAWQRWNSRIGGEQPSEQRLIRQVGWRIVVGLDGDRDLLLVDAVEPFRLHDQVLGKAIIENAEAGTNHGLGRCVLLAAKTPGKSKSRRPVAMVLDSVLGFITQPITHRHVRANLPIVFGVETGIHESVFSKRISGKDW